VHRASDGGFLRRIARRPPALVAMTFLVGLVFAVVAAGPIAPYDPLSQDLHHVFAGPSGQHLLGTDNLGRDILSRLLYGGRVSLLGVLEALATVLIVGVPAGMIAGYRGGWFDAIAVRITDVLLAIPSIVILLVVLSIFSQNEAAAMITLGLLGAPGVLRVVRGASMAVRPELFVTAARVSGLSHQQVVRRHVLPRVIGPIIVQASLFAGVALLTETGLGFLGLGVQEPEPSWGGMVAEASTVMSQDAWLLVPSGAAIGLTVLALGLLGDAVRDTTAEKTSQRPTQHKRTSHALRPAQPTTPMKLSAVLSVRGLSIAFPGSPGNTTVIQDVSFEIQPGETVGLVGESGCGKTVTALAILGLLAKGGTITSGSCTLLGQELIGMRNRDYQRIRGRQIGLISQDAVASLDPNYTVGTQIAQVVRRHQQVSRATARTRVIELLERVKMPDPAQVARKYPHELSGGMAQRVSIAAALAGNPRLLIADEPTTALDVTVQAEILDLLRDLQQGTAMAILLVTHDWGVVADLCQRVVVMYAGQVVESTSVAAMLARPLHPYTDGLLRANPHLAHVGADLPSIPGIVPAPAEWPTGCHFHPRCPYTTPECIARPVMLDEPHPGRLTRCLHHDQLRVGAAR
jgi:peptide/nickel transport system permease protein